MMSKLRYDALCGSTFPTVWSLNIAALRTPWTNPVPALRTCTTRLQPEFVTPGRPGRLHLTKLPP
eukprot:1189300-Prorocentrum_minimum.AAC.5